ncbi:hypothetical protein ACOMHN_020975 [Nucella lapillus]
MYRIQKDPCQSGEHQVTDDFRREVGYSTPEGQSHLCDAYLTTAWYRFLVNGTDATMPTSCVKPFSCGTQAPVWISLPDGPPEVGQEMTTRACSSWGVQGQETNCCFFPYKVAVRNCGDFFIYKLRSTQACSIAYCAEMQLIECQEGFVYDTDRKECVVITTPVPEKPTCQQGEQFNEVLGKCVQIEVVAVEIDKPFITTAVDGAGGAYVNCTWMPTSEADSDVSFMVTWYDAEVLDALQPILEGPSQLRLGTDIFAGTTVICGVMPVIANFGPHVNAEVLSDPFYLGLKVRESGVKVREDGRAVNLTLYSTIPIYCDHDTAPEECVLGVSFLAFGEDGELNERLRFSTCYVEFSAADCLGAVCMEHVIQATLYPNLEYTPSAPNEIVTLIGALDDFGRGLWRQEIVDIQLELEELPVAQCHVFTDPHVITFDGKTYDLYSRGTFVLHKSLARDFTMHLRVTHCGNNEGYCACGFVARDAGDVVSVDMCSGQLPPGEADVNFPGNFISDDVKLYKSKGGKVLTVVFASGTLIKTYLEPWGMSLSLLAPATDVGLSRGLCGLYDLVPDNDFHDAQGQVVKSASDRRTELQFIQSWKLPPASNFFDQPPVNDPQPLGLSSRCDCSHTSSGGICPLTSLVDDITPSVLESTDQTGFYFSHSRYLGDVDETPKTVTPGDEYGDVNNYDVPEFEEINLPSVELPGRRKRQASVRGDAVPDPTVDFAPQKNGSATYFFQPDYMLASAVFIPKWPASSGLNESEATDVCAEKLFGSNVALKCAEHLGSLLGTAFEFCKADLQVKGTASWAQYTLTFLESLCDLGLLQSARAFRKPGTQEAQWPKALGDAVACPRGCKNGECGAEGCVCEAGFSGPECEKKDEESTPGGEDFTPISPDPFTDMTTSSEISSTSADFNFTTNNATTISTPSRTTSSTFTTPSSTTMITLENVTTSTTTRSTTTTITKPTMTPSTTSVPATTATTSTPTTTTTVPTTTSTTTLNTSTTTLPPTTTPTTVQTTTVPTTTTTTTTITTTITPSTTTTIPTTTTTTQTTTTTSTTTTTPPTTSTTTTPTTTRTTTTPTTTTRPTTTTTTTPTTPTTTTTKPPTTSTPTTPTDDIADDDDDADEIRTRTTAQWGVLRIKTTPPSVEESTVDPGSGDSEIVIRDPTFKFVLCDVKQERCTDVTFDLTSREGPLRCRVTAVEAVSDARDNNAQTNETVIATIIFTIYDSVCRDCGVDGRYGCVTKADACYIDGQCYSRYQTHPYDSCLQCRPEVGSDRWSSRANNIAPVITFDEKPIVFVGQDVRFRIRVEDPDGSRLILSLNRQDAFIGQSGLFQWRPMANEVEGGKARKEEFVLIARDECNATATSKLEFLTVPCECDNEGTCVDPVATGEQYTYNCFCQTGYTGSQCELEVDDCAGSPCVNGQCLDLLNAFQCVCDPGFEGELCDTPADQCRDEPCYPGVLCQPVGGSYLCGACPPGLTGDGSACVDLDACEASPCFQGVACLDLPAPSDGFDCGVCPRFYEGNGQRCRRSRESACAQGVCSVRVTCIELTAYPGFKCGPCPYGYSGSGVTCDPVCERGCALGRVCVQPGICGCPAGFTGDNCNIPVCDPICRNGGVCVTPNVCRCFSGYTGAQCQETSCTPACVNNGRCIGRNRCLCPYGFTGNRCELQACQSPCQNGGRCVGPNRCRCIPGYQGRYCQHATCYPPCLNGGTCTTPGRCVCPPGYEGDRCERALCYPPCEHGGKCKRFNTCKCQPGYLGHRCQKAVCRPACMNGGRCVAPNVCSCRSGWSHHRCDRPLCHLPCRNGGLCFKPDICVCRRGYGGADCSKPICWPSCYNGWCLAPDLCHCRYGFYGPRCKKRKPRKNGYY